MNKKASKIQGEDIQVSETAVIEDGCELRARKIRIGDYVHIEKNCGLRAFGGMAGEIIIGDCCFIGSNTNVLVPTLHMGDYVTIHNHTLIYGFKPCILGHNCWIGQNSILNSNDVLKIGNNVGIGAYSQVWAHVYFGEMLEGCRIFSIAPTTIEDDVWLVGHCIVSPGVTIHKRAIVLAASLVTKDIPAETIYGGVPAENLTDKFPPWKTLTLRDKFEMMEEFIEDFGKTQNATYNVRKVDDNRYCFSSKEYEFKILFLEKVNFDVEDDEMDTIVITMQYGNTKLNKRVSLFDIETKTYAKRKTLGERLLIKFLNSYRARFLPRNSKFSSVKH